MNPTHPGPAIGDLPIKYVVAPMQWQHPWHRWHDLDGHCPHGRTHRQLDSLLRAVACENRRRTLRDADTEDQRRDTAYLRRAQAQLN
ncbi:hypothetical protein AB0H71_21780 [Nocardia sp. NPDC050697]|uniref:hypothetical protein n=1 Tax=Nocardia sp. NPDC050697 TaxID=3155158 RepID=UPI0033C08D89